ncbi:MAG: DUF3604 domain-containing protein [Myxococcota bacterium]
MFLLFLACTRSLPGADITRTEDREPCADATPTRKALYGDLHVHAAYSFDARNYGSLAEPPDVLAFAKGAPLTLVGGRTVQLDRPLDFVSATEHGDLLGEVAHCTTPGSPGYDAPICDPYRSGGGDEGALEFGVMLASDTPTRSADLCGPDGTGCDAAATTRWTSMQDAAEAAYDRTSRCGFTTFVGYEYTNTRGVSNLHRNVIFRNAQVPARPIGVFEAPRPQDLWTALADQCLDAGTGCDVMSLPHNSNLSNGRLFAAEELATDDAELTRLMALRARLEPVVEVFQHKGDSECSAPFSPDDPACAFEKLRPPTDPVCDAPGTGGMRLWGCSHRLDFVRNVLLEGLALEARIGTNPYRLGFIGSTDTHNGTPGLVRSIDFPGHVGTVDATPEDRLGEGNITHDAFINNPGGLAGVWAVENSRDAIFEALRRRETFATSGPRIQIRLFAADVPTDACDTGDLEALYRDGVPMGSDWDGPARFYIEAVADEASVGLDRIQLVKGWLDASGQMHESVVDVEIASEPQSLDTQTCDASGGAQRLCAVVDDPDDSAPAAFWYARALEVPTCRWSTRECNQLDPRPPRCDDGTAPDTVQQRAWSSPIWRATDGSAR